MRDTIAAISTALGVGAISIIRISGPEAIGITNSIFKEKDLTKTKTHTIHYGHIYNNEQIIDEVLVSIMRKPKTFTKEDVVEINCHGGIATTNKILEIILSKGARLAEPGEFTKRAFLNGRIDLVKAEAVMDLIQSKTEASRELAMNQLSGKVSKMIREIRQQILELLANIEVNIDYPEYEDIEEVTHSLLKSKLIEIKNTINKILEESRSGKLIKEGLSVALVGKPNVGKSSILNKLLDEERAIVTDIAGTTRDIIEGQINLEGILLNIIDTAGIRKTKDEVEKIGVERSRKVIKEADLVILVLSNNEKITEDELKLIEELEKKKHIILINKIDLDSNIELEKIKSNHIIMCNTIEKDGLDVLKEKIKELFNLGEFKDKDLTYLSNVRQIDLLRKTLNILKEAEEAVEKGEPIDIIEIDIKEAWLLLGEIIGETFKEDLIDQLFSQFCLGK
ncbi:MAG: tRNA uridine-5-carboxymethylaminomethyl(34) synthesis GTPase MnmE [Bacilli bacterium]|nr:tRNA uridine-5-carboxymethylaminomethyl(34) synthesis GTPase MnmE [Bacilli bacterium]